MFMTIFWAVGAVLLSIIAWQLIFVAGAHLLGVVVQLLWFLIRLPYFIALGVYYVGLGIWYSPRAIYRFFTCGWVPEFAWAAAVCLVATAVLAPIFSATF
jgi:hypothetical protein